LTATAKGVSAAIKGKDGKVDQRVQPRHRRVGIVPIPRTSGWKRWASKPTRAIIKTDGMCRTNVPGIWAIGDVTPGRPGWRTRRATKA
jgi:dihydrolipoamide dehydrogenase